MHALQRKPERLVFKLVQNGVIALKQEEREKSMNGN